jgi:hypothetical protein
MQALAEPKVEQESESLTHGLKNPTEKAIISGLLQSARKI